MMPDKTSENNSATEQLLERVRLLETRVENLEQAVRYASQNRTATMDTPLADESSDLNMPKVQREKQVSLEAAIGQFWLARIGAIILLVGVAFLISYPFDKIPRILASLFGFAAVAGVFFLAYYWNKTFAYLSRLLVGGGLVLLYLATLRLHFFSTTPLVASKYVGMMLILFALAASLYFTVKKKSEGLTSIVLTLCFATALLSDTVQFALILVVLSSAFSVHVFVRYNWRSLLVYSVILAYLTHLIWFFNNPVAGHPLKAISAHHNNLIYLFVYAALFSLAAVFRREKSSADFMDTLFTILNGFGILVLTTINIMTFFESRLSLIGFYASCFFLLIAVVNWLFLKNKYIASYYACFGYVALSIAIFSQFKSPDYFIWLGLQSLLVISTAIWFHSRIIIVANVLIYLGIYFVYLFMAPSHNFVNLSYAVTALASARILNWKKERLELKTDLIRNVYLFCTFVIVLYGLFHAVPQKFVSLSWLGAALFYFSMSLLLHNIKYRYLAIFTIFATVIHIFLIDTTRLAAGFRIIIFFAVGIIILLLSLIYSRYRKKIFTLD